MWQTAVAASVKEAACGEKQYNLQKYIMFLVNAKIVIAVCVLTADRYQ